LFAAVIAFFVSALITLLVIRTARLHSAHSSDHQMDGVQRMHSFPVPRVGGLGLLTGLFVGWLASHLRYSDSASWFALTLVVAGLPAFLAGFAEDLTKRVGALWRLIATMLAALIAGVWLGSWVPRVNVPGLDSLFTLPYFAAAFTVLVVAGVANAINIIDGLNGLASMVGMIMFGSIAYVAFRVGDATVLALALAMMATVAGFFLFNFPAGLIFLGDGGAYFLGFMLAECAILLVARNPDVSAWYAALLLIYPVWETIFSIYRRLILRKVAVGMPDAVHLHTLVFRRVMRWAVGLEGARQFTMNNSMSSPFLWLLSALAVFPATVLFRHTEWLMVLVFIFCVSYVWIYARVVRFKTPRWMRLLRRDR
jgi:UDP-N-acetylmuramyl pentapeptide phosphotransferase/UDP-N-acetylglucosamine-1-phosphate transferase